MVQAQTSRAEEELDYDIIGVGFGPANMAIAAACSEQEAGPRALFFEANSHTSWHAGMLFPDANLQVCFAKDLVTFRNPTSPLSFLNFLVSQGRIHDFFNRGSAAPLRIEFVAYLQWAAKQLTNYVRYGHTVEQVLPVYRAGRIDHYQVSVRQGQQSQVFTGRNVIIAAGLVPSIPQEWPKDKHIIHSSQYLHEIDQHRSVKTATVIGGGQSGAEVVLDLRSRYPEAEINLVHSRFGLTPADETPFVNRIFDNSAVTKLFNAPKSFRESILAQHKNTNYSVVNVETIQALYDAWYSDSWLGKTRLRFHDASSIYAISTQEKTVDVTVSHHLDDTQETISSDLVVLATGYRPQSPQSWLGPSHLDLARDQSGDLVIGRGYALEWKVPSDGKLVMLGTSEQRHGLSVTLLSNIALRAGEVLSSLTAVKDANPHDYSLINS